MSGGQESEGFPIRSGRTVAVGQGLAHFDPKALHSSRLSGLRQGRQTFRIYFDDAG